MKDPRYQFIAGSSAIAFLLVMCASVPGLLGIISYPLETEGWRTQCVMQDQLNLGLILPCLLASSLLALQQKQWGKYLWAACMAYLAYTFSIYCFFIHFNELFVVYCACLGVSVFSFLYFVLLAVREREPYVNLRLSGKLGVYFILFALIVALLWLSEIVPAILGKWIPLSIRQAGLFTNGVYVLDLSVVLPGIFITGLKLRRGSQLAGAITPAALIFFALMAASVGYMAFKNGQAQNLRLAIPGITILFTAAQLLIVRNWLRLSAL